MVVPVASSTALDCALVVAIGAVLVAPIVRRVIQRRLDPFEPIAVAVLAYGVMFVVRPAAMIVDDSRVLVGPRATLDVSATFTEMLVLALVGAVALVVGYELVGAAAVARRRPLRRAAPSFNAHAVVGAALAMACVGLVALTALVATSGGVRALREMFEAGNTALPESGSGAMYAWFLFLMTIPATVVILGVAFERRSKVLMATGAMLACLVLVEAIPTGSRITLLPFVGGILVFLYIRRRARPSIVTLAIVGVVALFASAFLSDLRGRSTRGETVAETAARAASPSRLGSSLTSGPDTEMAPALAAALAVIPEDLPHSYGKTIAGDLVVRPVPRGLWAEKPEVPRNDLLATIWPVEYRRGTINAEFSALLYFYWDFGVIGIVFGLMLYGVIFRWLYAYFREKDDQLATQVLYSLALWFVVIGLRDSPVDTVVRAVFVLAPVPLIFLVGRAASLTGEGRAARLDHSVDTPSARTTP